MMTDRREYNKWQFAQRVASQSKSQSWKSAGSSPQCGRCGHQVTGEVKVKKTKNGERFYSYYFCTHYREPGHSRIRITEAELDKQFLALFDRMRIQDEAVREWFRTVLVLQTEDAQSDSAAQRAELQRQATLLVAQQDRRLNLHLAGDIDQQTFGHKQTEFRDRLSSIKLQLDVLDRLHDEMAELAVKAFELSQTLKQQWLISGYSSKRRILEIILSNRELKDATLCPTIRKPFDVLAEGLLLKESGGGGNRTRRLLLAWSCVKLG
jgi:site-specific DNA recombinase